jgi:hypothetical protein
MTLFDEFELGLRFVFAFPAGLFHLERSCFQYSGSFVCNELDRVILEGFTDNFVLLKGFYLCILLLCNENIDFFEKEMFSLSLLRFAKLRWASPRKCKSEPQVFCLCSFKSDFSEGRQVKISSVTITAIDLL